MNIYAFSSLAGFIINTAIGIFVYLKNPNNKINRLFSLFCLTIDFWLFGCFAQSLLLSKKWALLFDKILYTGVAICPAVFLHFVITMIGLKNKRKLINIAYIISIVFVTINYIPVLRKFMIVNVIKKYPFRYIAEPGILWFTLTFLFIIYATYEFILIYLAQKKEKGHKQMQLRYLFVATVIINIAGSMYFLLVLNVSTPPIDNLLVVVYGGIMAYAIVRHQLMEIEVIIKKTLVFASLFTVVFGVFIGVTLLMQELIAGGRILGLAISSIIIIFAVRPLEDFLVRITDRFLFQKKYDYKHLIRQFMDELKIMVLNAHDIAQSTLDFLGASIRPLNSAIFMYNKFTNKYDVIASMNFKDNNLKIPDNTPLINRLKEKAEIISLSQDKYITEQDKSLLLSQGIEVIIPLIIHKDLLGILALGKKKSDEPYMQEDIDVLSDLSGALSIAINNAQLFDERADAEKRAMIGTLATGINHEIGNPLNVISIKLQSFRLLAEKGLLEKKTKEEIIGEVNNIAEVCLDSARRISDITRKISEFAKPDKQLVFDEVNVSEAIDATMAILGHELILERIKFEKDIACKSPYVIADRGQLQQIFFNLIKNAAQAIDKEDGRITINVNKHKTDEIIIKVIDNGPGIPDKDVDKIFMPFYTTKEPGKGTGLGLALVSRLVERNNGRIEVESKEGEGTTFTLVFKGKCYE